MQEPKYIIGCDEVGRGCLSGPVIAAAVCFPLNCPEPPMVIRDSKKMSAKARELATSWVEENSWCGYGAVPCTEIDSINILNATMNAMGKAIVRVIERMKESGISPDLILVDGNIFTYKIDVPHECVIKGDDKHLCISAASVIAKVSRDKIMKDYSKSPQYAGYGWETNAGYGTKAHIEAIHKLGITDQHRKTFLEGILSKA